MSRKLALWTSFVLGCLPRAQAEGTCTVLAVDKTFLHDPRTNTHGVWLRSFDLAATIGSNGLILRGPIARPEWETHIEPLGLGRNGRIDRPWSPVDVSQREGAIWWQGTHWSTEYRMEENGLRQNFHIAQRPSGEGLLELTLRSTSPLCPEEENGTGIAYRSSEGYLRHAYRGLLVWDDCGQPLEARLQLADGGSRLVIVVDDRSASYPITIDPVSTSFDRQLNAPAGGSYGVCVATAGDLNGDGYSDVAVGAHETANGGEVYVYYGTAAGIPAAPSVTLTSGRPVSNFGLGVDGAGDVNADGYSDLVVGASAWTDNVATPAEGAVFVYHGSATGIPTVPTLTLQTNTANSYMGSSVAGAGDINGDGYSDVLAGGWLAAYPNSGEGAVWVFLGSATGLNPVFRHRLERNQGGAQFGFSVNSAGDVNGDGFNDVIIGAPKFNLFTAPLGPPDDGAIYIFHGSAGALGVGLNPAPTLTFNTTSLGGERTGWAVSTAGDVNGDGYSDVIIGDWQDNIGPEIDEGVAVIYHGSPAGLNTTPVTTIQGTVADRWLGRSVSTAGDVNGDGYADVIIGAGQFTNGQTREGAAFVHLGSPTGINSSPFLRYESNQINGYMGEWVSTAGDVNGDGYSDMIVGIIGQTGGGGAQVFHGGAYNVSTTPSFTRSSGSANARMGAAAANAGDVNGDGYSDAIVGAPDASNGQAGEGLAFVHYGSITGLAAAPSLILEEDVAGAAFGRSVASAGDVNGDGYADVLVGAPLNGGFGRTYLYHGGPAGLNGTPALILNGSPGSLFGASVFKAGDHNCDGYSDVVIGAPGEEMAYVYPGAPGGLDPTPVVLNAPIAGGAFGSAVSTAGDVNGDGFSDVIIGAPDLSNGQALEGAFYVYHGDLFNFPTIPFFNYEGGVAGRRLGTSVCGAGDLNGDGFYDIAAGAPQTSLPEANEGMVFVFFGSTLGVNAIGSQYPQGNQVNAQKGFSVAEGGDVNGDGYADLVIGTPFFANGQANEGRVWVYPGSPTGVGANVVTLETNVVGENFGWAIAGGGDVDGDGYSDVLVGAPSASPTLGNEGTVRLFRGNNALAYNRLTRQYMTDLVSPLATNSADLSDAFFFGIGHRARSQIQRTTAKLRWEVVHEGQPFTGVPITNSVAFLANGATFTDLGLSGVEIKELVAKAPGFYRHKWRVRVEYPMHKMIDGQRFSRWFYGYASAVGDIGILPVELIEFQGEAVTEGNALEWTTGSEHQSAYFLVERSVDGTDFRPIGSVEAAGESARAINYAFLDSDAPNGLSYYRLRMVDSDGAEEFSNVIFVMRDMRSVVLYPIPVDDVLYWSSMGTTVSRAIVRDALGRVLIDASTRGDRLQGGSLQRLATGSYSILLLDEQGSVVARSRFLKR